MVQSYICKRRPQIARQISHDFHQKLQHLRSINSSATPHPKNAVRNTKKRGRNRRFIKHNRYRRQKRREATKQIPVLVHNLSDFKLTDDMISLLSRGRSFVPTPKNMNRTGQLADFDRYSRDMRWAEHFHNQENNNFESTSEEEQAPDIFKRSTNFAQFFFFAK